MKTRIKLILSTFAIYILTHASSNYYEPNSYYPGQDYYDYEEMDEYDTEPRHHRHRSYHAGKHHHNQEYMHADDCTEQMQYCSCNKCDNPSPCCQTFCASCAYMSAQSNLVFVPYPYPLMASNPDQNNTELALRSGVTTTTTEKYTTVAKVSNDIRNGEDLEMAVVKAPVKIKGGSSNRYMLTSLRRTKPTWVPKYGIVPIPDNLAEKLMSQLRDVREFKRPQ